MVGVSVVLPMRGLVVFPGMLRILAAGRDTSVRAIDLHLEQGLPLVLAPQIDPDEEDPLRARMPAVGVVARVLRVTRLPDGSVRLLVEGLERCRLVGAVRLQAGATVIDAEPLHAEVKDAVQVGALARELATRFQEYAHATGLQLHEHTTVAADADDPERLADQVMATTETSLEQQTTFLELSVLDQRLERALGQLATQIVRQRIHAEIGTRVQRAMDDSQREYHLKEQLKAIRAELGEVLGAESDAEGFEARIRASGMPDSVTEEAMREVERLRRVHTESAEYTIIRTWLETLCEIPWSKATVDTASLVKAERSLDHDHHGLDKVKERILEYLAVRQLQPNGRGAILCFVGPPGVGKTSLGQSIAHAVGRSYARIALGGIKDETEIRGHRRTYVGALPGRVVRALIRAGTRNPVLVLDEIDKVGNDFRGDPASALLEVLDPEQNHQFVDHYLDVPVDLSQVLFIATANILDPVPAALLDRLEVIEIPGYTEEDKIQIARRHLLPKLSREHGLEGRIAIEPQAVQRTIRDWTREAGVRDLERQLATLHRKVARRVVDGAGGRHRVRPSDLNAHLGPPRYFQEIAELGSDPGVVIGLAWTAAGGELLFVEATRMPGKQGLKMTGSLGHVMKESAEASLSWLRSHADLCGVGPDAFEAELHLHVPAGAIPKDGPSAGVTMVTALASLVTGRPVRERLAMTGEMTLRGKVLPVGGIKEKALAARRAGVRTLLLPALNKNDLIDIPEVLLRDLDFVFVDRIEDVLHLALGLPRVTSPPRAARSQEAPRAADRAEPARRRRARP